MSEVAFLVSFLPGLLTRPASVSATSVCHGFIAVGQQLTRWRMGASQNDLLFDKSPTRYVAVTNDEKEEALYSPSDNDSRKFGDGQPMKIRKLDWDSCLCNCVESSSN